MNRPDDNFDDLEHRLRSHYQQRADELRLEPRAWSAENDPTPGRPPVPYRRSTYLVAASVVVLVGAAVSGTMLFGGARGSESSATDGNITSATEPPAGNTAQCPGPSGPPQSPPDGWPNDFRSPGLLLPEGPAGYCVIDHTVSPSIGYSVGQAYTVWTDCACDEPSVAVALVGGASVTDEYDPRLPSQTVSVGAREAQYYAPGDGGSRFRLYTIDSNGQPVGFTGWGLDREQAIAALDEILGAMSPTAVGTTPSDGTTTAAERGTQQLASGLQEIYSGVVGPYDADGVPFAAEFSIAYWAERGGENLAYSVQRFGGEFGPIVTPPEAWLFAVPGSHLSSVDGQTVAVLGPTDGWNGRRTELVMVLDEHAAVKWSHDAPEPMTESQLAAIELSHADITDPRWDEIADESGQYDAVG